MVGWQHRFNGHELGQTSGDGEEQGGMACCSPWGLEKLDRNIITNSLLNYKICLVTAK